MQYTPLYVHSQYSILDSTLSVKAIVQKSKKAWVKVCCANRFL